MKLFQTSNIEIVKERQNFLDLSPKRLAFYTYANICVDK